MLSLSYRTLLLTVLLLISFYSGCNIKDVPYSRLVDANPVTQLSQKLDPDSKLISERSKSILSVPEIETTPKSSVSDSKLAVDYFNVREDDSLQQRTISRSLPATATDQSPVPTDKQSSRNSNVGICMSDSQHSLYVESDSNELSKQEVRNSVNVSIVVR